MNESIFLLHIFVLISSIFIALKLGRVALSILCTLFFLIANLFVTKQIELFSFTVTATDAYVVGGILSMNLLQEFFGKDEAKKQNIYSATLLTLFAILSQIHLLYAPSIHDQTQGAFQMLLGHSPRICISSLVVFFIAQRLDVELFSLFRKKLPFTLSIACSVVISQFVDTFFFSYLALYGIVHSISHIILISYVMKLLVMSCMTPFMQFAKWMMRRPA